MIGWKQKNNYLAAIYEYMIHFVYIISFIKCKWIQQLEFSLFV